VSLVVRTSSGPVAGRLSGNVSSWRGIPYAAAERFGPAGPVTVWSGERDATGPGPVGVQPATGGGLTGVEACLTLDVYAPREAAGPLPVLFWVHGGAFQTGAAADYDGSVLAAAGPAVVVAVSYRLGPFGFLQLGTVEEPAPSPAMTDLLAALAWVGREVAGFGGDPDRVTLVGQSAGASLVCALLGTPAGQRARAAIALSVGGPAHDPARSAEFGGRVLAELGLARTDLAALRALPVEAVQAAAAAAGRTARRESLGGVLWSPVVDGAVLPVDPATAIAAGALRDVPLWFGSCRDEMATFLRSGAEEASAVARGNVGDDAFDRLLAVYAGTAGAGEDPLQALLTDEMWVRPVEEMAVAQSAAGGRVWLSRWDHAPSLPPFDVLGPSHGADNACLWAHPPRFVERPLLARPGGEMTAADLAATRVLHDAVLGMVRTGSPAGALPDWAPYAADGRCTAVFDAGSRVESDPSAERRRAWEAVSRSPRAAGR
jgi:para-nitrobenzyl esterase